jgi:hypothetical protein
MTPADLHKWAHADDQRTSEIAEAVRALVRDYDALRRRASQMADELTRGEQRRIDLDITCGHKSALETECKRLRDELLAREADPWK